MQKVYVVPILVCFMLAVILVSNILVQYPIFIFGLEDILTWAAFTYPIAFFITDITNKIFGVQKARKIVYWGFFFAVILSIYLATPRIAIASGTAFIISQLLDIYIFSRLNKYDWWKAPLISSTIGSSIDTILFFSLAFSINFSLFGNIDNFAIEKVGIVSDTMYVSRWVLWAFGDFCVKLIVALILLAPFRMFYLKYNFLSER